jgi:hypothetical protein
LSNCLHVAARSAEIRHSCKPLVKGTIFSCEL